MSALRVIVVLLIGLYLSACAAPRPQTSYPIAVKAGYELDTGDLLRVQVYGDDQLSNTYRIDDQGNIAFPLIGSVPVRGVDAKTAAARITAGLANGYLRNPEVTVEIAEYRPFYIQGAVTSSGQYPYVYGMTIRAAISTAGGYSETANRTGVIIYRQQGNQMIKGKVGLDFPVYPGDTIVVPENWL